MIKGILEEFFAGMFILTGLWFAGRYALNLYKKFWDVSHQTTKEGKSEKVKSDTKYTDIK